MALKSIKAELGFASHVIAFNGRCAGLSETASIATTIHLIHGGEDPAIDLTHTAAAQEALISAGSDVTLDIVEDLGYAIDNRSTQLALDRLRYTVPKHYLDEALNGGKLDDDDVIEMM